MNLNKDDNKNIKERLFIVGSPRSGTTILQSLLAAHPLITSFPETHFFAYATRNKFRKFFRLTSSISKDKFYNFLKDLDERDMKELIPKNTIFLKKWINCFVKILDAITIKRGNEIWIEKTPRHLHYIDLIERYIKDAKFIHIIRNGKDVVASVYEVTHKYPEQWGGKREINQIIDRWNNDVKITKKYINNPNHFLVKFDDLLQDTEYVSKELCDFIGINFSKKMLENNTFLEDKLILDNEPWKNSVKNGIKKTTKKKFNILFDEEQKAYIKSKIEDFEF